MGRLRGRVNRLRARLAGQIDYLELEDGSRHYYRPEDARAAVFLSKLEVGRAGYFGKRAADLPDLIKAVARGTPGSRREFIETYGDPFRGPATVDGPGSRVKIVWCALDGELQTELLEGEEAQDYIREAQGRFMHPISDTVN